MLGFYFNNFSSLYASSPACIMPAFVCRDPREREPRCAARISTNTLPIL